MKLYRLCNFMEYEYMMRNSRLLGNTFLINSKVNSHCYKLKTRYLHFFSEAINLLYLNTYSGNYVCMYDIDDELLIGCFGVGKYFDLFDFKKIVQVGEYAVPVKKLEFDNLKEIYLIQRSIFAEDYLYNSDLFSYMEKVYDSESHVLRLIK